MVDLYLHLKKPADNIPKSYRVYEKNIDAKGNFQKLDKITIGPKGELVHIKTIYPK